MVRSQNFSHESMGDVRFDELFALGAVADRLVERNCRSLGMQDHLGKAAIVCFGFDRKHQFGTDTTATRLREYSDALGLTGVRLRVHARGTHRLAITVGEEVHADRIEIVELLFARNALFFHEHDPADSVAGCEFRCRGRAALDHVDLSVHDSPLDPQRGRHVQNSRCAACADDDQAVGRRQSVSRSVRRVQSR